jgi:hypothetical protein
MWAGRSQLPGQEMFMRMAKLSCWVRRPDWAGPAANSAAVSVRYLSSVNIFFSRLPISVEKMSFFSVADPNSKVWLDLNPKPKKKVPVLFFFLSDS